MQATIDEILKQTAKRPKMHETSQIMSQNISGNQISPLNSPISANSSYNKENSLSIDSLPLNRKRNFETPSMYTSENGGLCRINVSQINHQTLAQQIQNPTKNINYDLTSYEISPGACRQLSLPLTTRVLNLPTLYKNSDSDSTPPLPLISHLVPSSIPSTSSQSRNIENNNNNNMSKTENTENPPQKQNSPENNNINPLHETQKTRTVMSIQKVEKI